MKLKKEPTVKQKAEKLKEETPKEEPKEAELKEAPSEVPKVKKEKPKATKKTESDELALPAKGFINKYHFMRLNAKILKELGWPTDERVNITLDVQDGSLVIKRKA